MDRYPNIGNSCWSRERQHFRIDEIHISSWEKDIENTKDGATNHCPLCALQLLLVLQKPLRGTGISTLFSNNNIPEIPTTPTFPLPPATTTPLTFLNGPSILHYSFPNYYQTIGAPFVLPIAYTSNYHIPSAIL